MAGSLTTPAAGAIALPPVKIAPLTAQANEAMLRSIREGYSNKVGLKASTADGGTGQLFVSVARERLQASGYLGGSRRGLEVGGEVTFDLNRK